MAEETWKGFKGVGSKELRIFDEIMPVDISIVFKTEETKKFLDKGLFLVPCQLKDEPNIQPLSATACIVSTQEVEFEEEGAMTGGTVMEPLAILINSPEFLKRIVDKKGNPISTSLPELTALERRMFFG